MPSQGPVKLLSIENSIQRSHQSRNDLARLNTQTNKVAREFYKKYNGKAARSKRYFRSDIPGLGDIEMDESKELNTIEEASNEYLNNPEVGSSIETCSTELAEVYDPSEICGSLKRYVRNPRYDQIPFSHRKTFDWIWKPNAHGFPEWLTSSDQDKFWISGKPGSGKSTLMKFILTHKSLWDHLATEPGVLSGETHFFFQELSGEDPDGERSIDGLLHTILLRLLELCPSFVPCVSALYESNVRFREIPATLRSPWSAQILERVLENIAQHSSSRGIMWIFVDGFDECQGNLLVHLNFLINWVESMNRTPFTIKLCISSRDISSMSVGFEKAQLELHEWTADDISLYVRDQFKHTKRETILLNDASQGTISQPLVKTIVKNAEGVFMWVRLVVAELLVSWADGAEEEELYAILEEVPKKLEDLYANIIRKIPDQYLRDGFNYFRLLIRAPGGKCSLSLLQFLLAIQKPQQAIKCQNQYQHGMINQEAILSKQELMKKRLKSRCGNLIHVQPGKAVQKKWDSLRRDRVVLIHRTVKDYIQKESVEKGIRQRVEALGQDLIPTVDILLMASCLMLLKTQPCYVPCWATAQSDYHALPVAHLEEKERTIHTPSKDGEVQTPGYGEPDDDDDEEELDTNAPDNLITKFFNYAGNLEHALDKPQVQFIKELNKILCKAHKNWPREFYRRRTLCDIQDIDILCLAVCWNLKLYVKKTLNDKEFKKKRSHPLLFYAMNPPGWSHESIDLEMLDILLGFGTEEGQVPNYTFEVNDFHETMWGHTLRHYLRIGTADPADKWEEVLERMLRHGSDPNERVHNRDGSYTFAANLLIDQFVESAAKDHAKIEEAFPTLFHYGARLDVEDSDHILVEEYAKIRSPKLWNFLVEKRQAMAPGKTTAPEDVLGHGPVLGKRKRTRSIA